MYIHYIENKITTSNFGMRLLLWALGTFNKSFFSVYCPNISFYTDFNVCLLNAVRWPVPETQKEGLHLIRNHSW